MESLSSLSSLEQRFEKAMESFESRFMSASSTVTLNQIAKDFQNFKTFVRDTLIMLRSQMSALITATDDIETRSRRKFLLFRGVKESKDENIRQVIADIGTKTFGLDISAADINFCYRLGTKTNTPDKPRPILVKFKSSDLRTHIWRSKKELKGTSISLAEFLTAIRRRLHAEGRRVYGMNNCWSQEGQVYIKFKDGNKCRITSENHLNELIAKYPPEATEIQNKKSRTARNVKPRH